MPVTLRDLRAIRQITTLKSFIRRLILLMELLSVDLDMVLELLELRVDRGSEVCRRVRLLNCSVLHLRMTLTQVVAL